MSQTERNDALLILEFFGPMTAKTLSVWYNQTFRRRRKITPEEMERELWNLGN